MKRYILWLGLLTAALFSGCSEEHLPDLPDRAGTTLLRIQTKGIVINPVPSDDRMDEYVKTLRLIGYQEGQPVLNQQLSDWSGYEVKNPGPDSYIEIPMETLQGATLQRGSLDLYAVANEQQSLSLDNIAQEKLKQQMVEASSVNNRPTQDNPLLMSAEVHPTLLQEKNEIKINLVRSVGKVELTEVTQEGQLLTGYSYQLQAEGDVYARYPLFGKVADMGTKFVSITSKDVPLFLSVASALTLTVTVTHDGNTYRGFLTDVSITRNKSIRLHAQISKKDQCLLLQSTLVDWTPVELNPDFQ